MIEHGSELSENFRNFNSPRTRIPRIIQQQLESCVAPVVGLPMDTQTRLQTKALVEQKVNELYSKGLINQYMVGDPTTTTINGRPETRISIFLQPFHHSVDRLEVVLHIS